MTTTIENPVITLYSKTSGCTQCTMTKTSLVKHGLGEWDSSNILTANLVSAVPGLEIKTVLIDQPENAEVLEWLKEENLVQAPIVMLSFPVTGDDGVEVDTWSGFRPDLVKATAKALGV